MKTLWILTIIFFCSLMLHKEVHAGKTSDAMYSVYIQSFSNPEIFDTYIAQNKSIFDAAFFACTERLLLKYAARSKEHVYYCRGYEDPQLHQQCMAQNLDAQFGDWLLSLVAAIKNGTPWCKTSTGSFNCQIKQLSKVYDSLFPGLKEEIAQKVEPLNRLYLNCD